MTNEYSTRSAPDADEVEALHAIGWRPATDGTACPDSSLLIAAEEGVLDDAALASRIRTHVEHCATCRQLAADMASVLAQEPTPAEQTRIGARIHAGRKPARAAAGVWLGAGGLALAAGLAWLFLMPRPSPPPSPDVQVAKVTPPIIPSVFVLDRPAIPPGDVDLTLRGESSTRVSLPDQIAAALDAADRGDLPSATAALERVVRRNPNSRSAGLALGALQLRADRDAAAVATLSRAKGLRTDRDLDDEVDWFLSIALVRTGDRDQARALLGGVCRRGGPRSAGACAGVAEINRTASPR
jgi:hypothetical protein